MIQETLHTVSVKYSLILWLEGALHQKSSYSTFSIWGAMFLDLKYNLIVYSVIFGMIITSTESCFGKIEIEVKHFWRCLSENNKYVAIS